LNSESFSLRHTPKDHPGKNQQNVWQASDIGVLMGAACLSVRRVFKRDITPKGGLLMKKSIVAMVAIACASMSTVVFADEMDMGKFSGGLNQDMNGLSDDMSSQKAGLMNDIKAKRESAQNEMKTKREELKAKKRQAKADLQAKKGHVKAKANSKKEAVHAKAAAELKGAADGTLHQADGRSHDLKDAMRN
jgi:hypothetical protein